MGRRINDAAMHAFLAALKSGATREDAARVAGFSLATFYRVRVRDTGFAAAWEQAVASSAVPRIIAPTNGRRLQSRKFRSLRFNEARRETFLAHFAGTCNVAESAEIAGVCEATVYRHRVKDASFAAAFQEALEQGYVRLEAEALRQRIEAQRRIREAGDGLLPAGEATAEFERILKLLDRWDRRNGCIGPRAVAHGSLKRWTFDDAIEALEKKLMALGYDAPDAAGSLSPTGDGTEG